MKKVNKIKQFIALVALTLASSGAMAIVMPVPITGWLDMGGGAYVMDETGAYTNNAAEAVAIDFSPNNFRVLAASGSFAGMEGSIGDIKDLAFGSFTGPVADFWTVGDFSFELTSVARGISNDPGKFLVLNGSGIIRADGYEDTLASWSFSADTTGNGAFSWNAKSATEVPEPGILAMLSLGLIGFGLRKFA